MKGMSLFTGLVVVTVALLLAMCGIGCAAMNSTPIQTQIESAKTTMIPMVKTAVEGLNGRTANLAVSGSLINPEYDVEVEGYVVTGFKGHASVAAKGISGTVMGNLQSDNQATVAPGSVKEKAGTGTPTPATAVSQAVKPATQTDATK